MMFINSERCNQSQLLLLLLLLLLMMAFFNGHAVATCAVCGQECGQVLRTDIVEVRTRGDRMPELNVHFCILNLCIATRATRVGKFVIIFARLHPRHKACILFITRKCCWASICSGVIVHVVGDAILMMMMMLVVVATTTTEQQRQRRRRRRR